MVIKNLGDIDAKNVNVALFVDDKFVRAANIVRVQNGTDDLLVTIYWQARSGKHEVKIVLDQDNNIAEQNDQFQGKNNNEITKTIIITGARKTEYIDQNEILIYLGLIVLIAISAILIIFKTRKFIGNRD